MHEYGLKRINGSSTYLIVPQGMDSFKDGAVPVYGFLKVEIDEEGRAYCSFPEISPEIDDIETLMQLSERIIASLSVN